MKMSFYSTEEQETNINYESYTREYTIYTTVPKHIRRLEKKYSMFEIVRVDKDSEGVTIALQVKGKKLPPASTFN
jgi:hypothetical protein